jgi:hypothetical protein
MIRNWFKLWLVQRTMNKYKLYNQRKRKVNFSTLIKRATLNVLRLRLNGITLGILVSSTKKKRPGTTYIDLLWVNEKYTKGFIESEGAYYQALYDTFISWYNNFTPKCEKDPKIALALNITNKIQVERLRRILTLYGFQADADLTLEEVAFKAPYRDKEKITYVIYSRRAS